MSRHDTQIMLIKSGLVATEMAEPVGVYRQMAQEDLEGEIATALAPMKQRKGRRDLEVARDFLSAVFPNDFGKSRARKYGRIRLRTLARKPA
jgi:hypothetical protein